MTQNPTDIRIRLGIAQTLCFFLYEKDMEKSIEWRGSILCPLWTEPPIHTQYSFITQGQIIYYSTFREREHGCDPMIDYMCVREGLCTFGFTNCE